MAASEKRQSDECGGDQTASLPKKQRASGSTAGSLPPHAAHEALTKVPSLIERFDHTPDADKVVFVMVGLPARGKSFISMRLARFLQWTGIETRVFNAGNHRRSTETGTQDASYFDPQSTTAVRRREEIAMAVMEEMLTWLTAKSPRFAVFDATNTTRTRRLAVAKKLRSKGDIGAIFVESICDDPAVLEANTKMKLEKSPDYQALPEQEARADLMKRIGNYDSVYEPIDETELDLGDERLAMSYIKLHNLSSHVVAHNIWGRAAMPVLPYLMALHIGSRPIWLCRTPHAEITPQVWRAGGRPWPPPPETQFSEQPLSEKGAAFSDTLAAFVRCQAPRPCTVFCCHHRRAMDVATRLGGGRVRTGLNPQDRGACNGLSAGAIRQDYPDIWTEPLENRFPGGENLSDMVQRLLPVLIEVEQEMRPVLVIAPLSVLQVFYCYFAGKDVARALEVKMPLHTITEIRPDGGTFSERRLTLDDLQAGATSEC